DPPIDEGFQTNLLGAVRFYERVLESGGHPHIVHVSTAYVAGNRKGVIPEATLAHRVDWQAEAEFALQARQDVEASSRQPQVLDRLMAKARREHSRAGPQTVADDAEDRRKQGVTKRLVAPAPAPGARRFEAKTRARPRGGGSAEGARRRGGSPETVGDQAVGRTRS